MTFVKPEAYRQSLIGTADSCMRRALYALTNEIRSPSGAAALGTILHRTLATGTGEMVRNSEPRISPEQILEIYGDELCQRRVPAKEVVPISMREMARGRIALTKWATTFEISVSRVVGIEIRKYADLTLPTGKTVQVTGQLDLLLADPSGEGAIVIDWKTGWGRPKQEDGTEGRGLTELGWAQSVIYAHLVFTAYPSVQFVIFREWHLMWGEVREVRIDRWNYERTADVLAAQVALLDQAVEEGEESERWVASPGPHCALCSGTRRCPIRKQVGIPADEEEARQLAGEWILAGEIRKERAPLLKGYVDAWGPIEVPHSRGRRFVGWDTAADGKRTFGIFEAKPDAEVPESLEAAAREAGVLTDE